MSEVFTIKVPCDKISCKSAKTSVVARFSKTFTDDPISSEVPTVKAIHITELRQAINTLRANTDLLPFSRNPDPTLTAGVTQIKAEHITELRTALNGIYDALSRARTTYTDSTLAAQQTVIKKAHIAEIRSAVRDVE